MATSKMENPLWKKLQNDPNFLKLQQQQQETIKPPTTILTSPITNQSLPLNVIPLKSISNSLNIRREIGAIEKILTSYGFVKCLTREGRYFFHYSTFQGDVAHLKIGDLVEFEESIDKRTGKPIAINLIKCSIDGHIETENEFLFNQKIKTQLNQSTQQQQQQQQFSNAINSLKNPLLKQHQQQQTQNDNKKEVLGDQMFGLIAIVSKLACNYDIFPSIPDGRITYTKNGETFYIPYALNDVTFPHNNTSIKQLQLKQMDHVKFYIAQNVHMGTIYARKIELITDPSQVNLNNDSKLMQNQTVSNVLYRGIVSTLKDTFGRIEREDKAREILFHFTELKGNLNDLHIGANVQFEIDSRHGKEIATCVKLLPHGTVSFHEISKQMYIGRILNLFSNANNNFFGKIIFDFNEEKLVEIEFKEQDQVGRYTLFENDIVQFKISIDKRTSLKRAVNVCLMEHSLLSNKEKREFGIINQIIPEKASISRCGAIVSVERDELVYFSFNEFIQQLTPQQLANINSGDCVEFSVIEERATCKAIRIRLLPPNSVKFEVISDETHTGFIEKEPNEIKMRALNERGSANSNRRSEITFSLQETQKSLNFASFPFISSSLNSLNLAVSESANQLSKYDPGLIIYTDTSGHSKYIQYLPQHLTQNSSKIQLYLGDKVEFNLLTLIKEKKQFAVNIKLIEHHYEHGYIAVMKENYGFIEMVSQPRDLFFHFSSSLSPVHELDIGDEVRFTIKKSVNKLSAENLTKVPNGTINTHNLVPFLYKGRIHQSFRSHNDQDEYYGKVQICDDNGQLQGDLYLFGIGGLADRKQQLLPGDLVSFQIGIGEDGNKRAFNLAKRTVDLKRAKIESLKGQYGFIDYANGDNKKLFFSMNDIEGGLQLSDLKIGDEVEFQISTQKNGKNVAIRVKRLNLTPVGAAQQSEVALKRPERLITKLKATNIDDKNSIKLVLVRQPKNPDGKMKSFSRLLIEREPGSLTSSSPQLSTPNHFNNLLATNAI